MQPLQHQMMGYDRASTMFSPDGRLLQVEYAKKAVKGGITAIGLVCKDGVLLVADRRLGDKLMVPESVEKVFQVDDHIAATLTGFVMDGRYLIERAQLIAQQNRVTTGEPIDVLNLVKEIADIKQMHTMLGGARPFGVSIMFAGVDDDKRVYVTDPTGIFFGFKATVIGEGDMVVREVLEKEYKENMDIDTGLALAISALKKFLGKQFSIERVDGAYILSKDKQYRRLEKDRIFRASKK